MVRVNVLPGECTPRIRTGLSPIRIVPTHCGPVLIYLTFLFVAVIIPTRISRIVLHTLTGMIKMSDPDVYDHSIYLNTINNMLVPSLKLIREVRE